MSTQHTRRGRHKQAARNLMIAVTTATLAGSGAAIAANGGAAPPTTKSAPSAGAPVTKPADALAGSASDGSRGSRRDPRAPLLDNEPVVTQVRARLAGLVAAGTIEQAEADVVLRDVRAGRVEPDALVRAGKVSSAHMPAIMDTLRQVKEANAPAGG